MLNLILKQPETRLELLIQQEFTQLLRHCSEVLHETLVFIEEYEVLPKEGLRNRIDKIVKKLDKLLDTEVNRLEVPSHTKGN